MKKHQEIDWNENDRINPVTKQCLNYLQENYTFEEYLEERAKKDAKFVSLTAEEEEAPQQGSSQQPPKNESEFSMSDEYDQEEPFTDVSKGSKKKWNREMAEQYYSNTKVDIESRLNGEYLLNNQILDPDAE